MGAGMTWLAVGMTNMAAGMTVGVLRGGRGCVGGNDGEEWV